MQFLKQSTAATTVVGPILDSTGAEYTGAVIGDMTITKNGTSAAMASAATLTHIANGHYTLVFTTGNTDTAGRLDIHCNKSTYQMPPRSFQVCVATVFDALVTNATTAAGGLGDVQRINGISAGSVSAIASHIGTTGANTAQTGDSYALANSGTFGLSALKTLIDTLTTYVDTEVAAIKAKTDNLPPDPADASDIAASFSSIASTLSTIAAYIDTEVAAIKAKTDNLPSDPADASDIAASFTSAASALAAVSTLVSAIKAITDNHPANLKNWLGALAGKTADSGTLAEIQATTAGAGYDNTTDSLQALKDSQVDTDGLAEDVADAVVESLGSSAITFVSPLSADGTTLQIVTGDSYTAENGRSLTFSITGQSGLIGATPYLRMDGILIATADPISSGTQTITMSDVLASTTSLLQPGINRPYQLRFVDGVDVATPINGLAEIIRGFS